MFVKVKLIPRRIRTAGSFEAPDPWNGGRVAPFRLEVYKLFPGHVTDPRDFRDGTMHTWGAKAMYGIRSEIDGVERLLPTFLGEAWAAGKVTPERLPGLLASIPDLTQKDFRPAVGAWALRLALAGLGTALAAGAALFWLVGGFVPKPATPLTLSPEAFLSRPLQVGESIVVSGMVPLAGRSAATGLVVSKEIAKLSPGGFTLAWARTPSGHRALLLPAIGYVRDGAADLGWTVALAPGEVGLTAALEALRRHVDGLDTSVVAASRWVSARNESLDLARAASVLAGIVGLSFAAGFGAAWIGHAPQRRRNRMLLARTLGEGAIAPR
jgi:hypothetical protein